LLQLPNVRVINATPAQRSAMSKWDAQSASASMRAYKDPETGQLREQSPEEAAKEGGLSKSAARGEPINITSPYGGTIMALDDSFMVNSVVTRDASGKMLMQCVTGGNPALEAVKSRSAKEHRHDH
jgi:hypothetical protein